ncbi:MAG: response regulator [Clostridiales bacterium]|jgi:two-component system response regulator YesN|nr:response regulator [Clostridiales bacterium]
MLKAILVDDEPLVRKRLKSLVDWCAEGFVLEGEAEDGEEGLALALETKPDLILADIRMPAFSGLELIKMLKAPLPEACFIILSGYSEFSYAKQALQMGVISYLLKPVDADELAEALGLARNKLAASEGMKAMKQEADKARRDKWAQSVLDGANTPIIEEFAQSLGIDLAKSRFGVLAAELNGLDERTDEDEISAVMERAEEAAIAAAGENGFVLRRGLWGWTVLHISCDPSAFPEAARAIKSAIEKSSSLICTIGVSQAAEGISLAKGLKKEAESALEARFMLGEGKIIGMDDFHMPQESWNEVFSLNSQELTQAMENNLPEEVAGEIGKLFDFLRAKQVSLAMAQSIVIERIVSASRLVSKLEGNARQALGGRDPWDELKQKKSLASMRQWMTGICLGVTEYIAKLRRSRASKVSAKVKELVHARYSEDVTLKSISREVYMNPVYLGQVFKSETGVTFNDYLTATRIGQASSLLADSDIPVNEIAEKVGYMSPGNFFKAFKKLRGCTPSDYRLMSRGQA